MLTMKKKIGMDYQDINPGTTREDQINYINFKLAAMGLPIFRVKNKDGSDNTHYIDLFEDIIKDYKEKVRKVDLSASGIHRRINEFFSHYFQESEAVPRVIEETLTLDHYGLAREMSLPADGNTFSNGYVNSFRIKQGILNNPKSDRRTTAGSFHVVEGPLAIPSDKKSVPKETFVRLYKAAIKPPEELMVLPFTANQSQKAKTFVSLLTKPIVSPKVPGVLPERSMEVLFIAPGSFVSNLDFIESIFGNFGAPGNHRHDSGLDVDSWSGHTGFILLAPHLTKMRKVDLALPHFDDATERQRRDGMCYHDETELYNDGQPFKLTCRDSSGVAVTLIADNYYGYSKKEIKTQISFAANLYGNVEEEHAGGTIAYQCKNLGFNYNAEEDGSVKGYFFDDVIEQYSNLMDLQENHYGIDKLDKRILYLPENIKVDLYKTEIKWQYNGATCTLKLLPDHFYVLPNGDRFHIERHPEAPIWKLVGTEAEGTFCHKPCTVSGGGKSEISKSISNSIIYGSYYVDDLQKALDQIEVILNYDYSHRWKENPNRNQPSRTILSLDRTLGSVIKLLTPSTAYTDDFNAFLESIPNDVKSLVFMVKRFYQKSWGSDWRKHFTVDYIDGKPGHELKFDNRTIRSGYLRVGYAPDGSWRIFKLRVDYMPCEKIHMEDDITASVLVPSRQLKHLNPNYANESVKFTANCEYRFFQRPDDAVIKGYDKQAEEDLSSDNLFATNYQPLTKADVEAIKEDSMGFVAYSEPVKNHIEAFLKSDSDYCVVSSEPRLVDGKPSKNPRYLERRSDFTEPVTMYLADISERFNRRIPKDQPVYHPVNAVLPGRRNNPPSMEKGKKILPLAVYNPIHYQELPELFMDYISSLTGKSPSTTGAGSEGALTKGPFNMLLPVYDLNSALLSYILGGYNAFSTPAGHIGANLRVDHDISIMVPEIWARLKEADRDPRNLIAEGSLEKIEDFEHDGVLVPASRLGYRMTDIFCYKYLGKLFDEPQAIFSEDILKPELQGLSDFVDGVLNIANGHKKAALDYFEDHSIQDAIPPIRALLHIMAYGEFEGHTLNDESIRTLFTKDYVLNSPWYAQRLRNKQQIEINLMTRKIANLEDFIANPVNASLISEFHYDSQLRKARETLAYLQSAEYLDSLKGTIGAETIGLR